MIGYIRRQKDDNNKILRTALPLVGSISKRRRSQRKVTFSHFSIGSRPLGFESQNHIAIKKTAARTVFLWRQRRDFPLVF